MSHTSNSQYFPPRIVYRRETFHQFNYYYLPVLSNALLFTPHTNFQNTITPGAGVEPDRKVVNHAATPPSSSAPSAALRADECDAGRTYEGPQSQNAKCGEEVVDRDI